MPKTIIIANSQTIKNKVIGIPLKADGTKDKRYNTVQILKNDGTKDKRTKVKNIKL